MRRRTIFCALALGLLGSGCAAVTDAAHATGYWTQQAVRDSRERHRNRQLADAAWVEVCGAKPGGAASEDYADGFKAGFADHLYRGTNEPPPLPPKQYRELRYRTPAGFRAGEDWLAGFRYGTDRAHASGLRELVTGPSSLHANPAGPGPAPAAVAPPIGAPVALPMPPPDPLPAPRSIAPPRDDVKPPPEPDPEAMLPRPSPALRTGRLPEAQPPEAVAAVRHAEGPDWTLRAKPPVVADAAVVPASYQPPAPRGEPLAVPVSYARHLIRRDLPRWLMAVAADVLPRGAAPLPACEWVSAEGRTPAEERSLPPVTAPGHWEGQR